MLIYIVDNNINSIEDFYPTGLDRNAQAALLIEVDGNINDVANQLNTICNVFDKFNVSSYKVAENEIETQNRNNDICLAQ